MVLVLEKAENIMKEIDYLEKELLHNKTLYKKTLEGAMDTFFNKHESNLYDYVYIYVDFVKSELSELYSKEGVPSIEIAIYWLFHILTYLKKGTHEITRYVNKYNFSLFVVITRGLHDIEESILHEIEFLNNEYKYPET